MFFLLLQSCIVPFYPLVESRNINKFVVSGQVNDNDEIQTVSVSVASPVGDPEYIPVSGCSVTISDDRGNQFEMKEAEAGKYQAEIDKGYLVPGISFKVDVITSDGIHIQSDFDRMNECPGIDTLYYVRKVIRENTPDDILEGLQFYIDLDAGNSSSHYFRWEAVETWESHVPYARKWYFDGTVHHIFPPDSSKMVCWTTEKVQNIYTLSTQNFVENRYSMLPLNFVDNSTAKLMYGYSLLVNQISLSEAAFTYWDQLRVNSFEQGELYEKQPLSVTGNLHNITDPDQKVLGFFCAASVKSKRIFISPIDDFEFNAITYCRPDTLRHGGLREIRTSQYPAYLDGNDDTYFLIRLGPYCVDCTKLGGTTVKPDFWPK